jgi:hypothetical protein
MRGRIGASAGPQGAGWGSVPTKGERCDCSMKPSPRGYTEAILLAHGFGTELLAGLVRDGLASNAPESIHAGARSVAVARLRITEAGRRTIRPSP